MTGFVAPLPVRLHKHASRFRVRAQLQHHLEERLIVPCSAGHVCTRSSGNRICALFTIRQMCSFVRVQSPLSNGAQIHQGGSLQAYL